MPLATRKPELVRHGGCLVSGALQRRHVRLGVQPNAPTGLENFLGALLQGKRRAPATAGCAGGAAARARCGALATRCARCGGPHAHRVGRRYSGPEAASLVRRGDKDLLGRV